MNVPGTAVNPPPTDAKGTLELKPSWSWGSPTRQA